MKSQEAVQKQRRRRGRRGNESSVIRSPSSFGVVGEIAVLPHSCSRESRRAFKIKRARGTCGKTFPSVCSGTVISCPDRGLRGRNNLQFEASRRRAKGKIAKEKGGKKGVPLRIACWAHQTARCPTGKICGKKGLEERSTTLTGAIKQGLGMDSFTQDRDGKEVAYTKTGFKIHYGKVGNF